MKSRETGRAKLRVLHVYRTYYPDKVGGLLEAIRQICHSTQPLGVENRIFTLSSTPKPAILRRDEATVYRFPLHLEIASTGISATALGGFRELGCWADVIHYHVPWPFADVLHALGRISTPAVATYHSDVVRQRGFLHLYTPLMHWFLGRMRRIVATSPNYVETSPVLQRFVRKVEVIPLALDELTYPQPLPDAVAAFRERFGEGFFLFIGVLRYYKGLHTLLDSVAGTDIRLIIVGTGPEEDLLKQRIEREKIRNATMLGFVGDEEKVALIKLSAAVVLPSHLRSEAFGISLIEGAMYGKPLISCEIGTGTSYVNRTGETGFVIPPEDASSLREAMMRLSSNQELAEQLGRGAREHYERLLTSQPMGREYVRLYESMVKINAGDR